jgi:hypothetical protein
VLICAAPLGLCQAVRLLLTTVHAKLEATVLRARRHQGVGTLTAKARACAECLRNAAAVARRVGALGGGEACREGREALGRRAREQGRCVG